MSSSVSLEAMFVCWWQLCWATTLLYVWHGPQWPVSICLSVCVDVLMTYTVLVCDQPHFISLWSSLCQPRHLQALYNRTWVVFLIPTFQTMNFIVPSQRRLVSGSWQISFILSRWHKRPLNRALVSCIFQYLYCKVVKVFCVVWL